MRQELMRFWKDEDGATAVEYALIAGLIALALITALGIFSDALSDFFTGIGDKLDAINTDINAE